MGEENWCMLNFWPFGQLWRRALEDLLLFLSHLSPWESNHFLKKDSHRNCDAHVFLTIHWELLPKQGFLLNSRQKLVTFLMVSNSVLHSSHSLHSLQQCCEHIWSHNRLQMKGVNSRWLMSNESICKKTWMRKKLFDLIFWYKREFLALDGRWNFAALLLLDFVDKIAIFRLRKCWYGLRVLFSSKPKKVSYFDYNDNQKRKTNR